MLTLNMEQAARAVITCFLANVPVILWGPCGVGKSQIIKAIAKKLGWLLFDVRVSDKEPVDFGAPHPEAETGILKYYLSELIPFERVLDAKHGGKDKPTILFLDEVDRCEPAVRNVTLQLFLDREMNGHRLGENVRVVCAGNGTLDMDTIEMSVAQRSRICHIYVDHTSESNLRSYEAWAEQNGISKAMRAFARFRHDVWISDAPQYEDLAVKTPRSWDAADRLCQVVEAGKAKYKTDDVLPALVAGCIGQAETPVFLAFRKGFEKMIDPDTILADASGAPVPTETDALMATASTICDLFGDDYHDDRVTASMSGAESNQALATYVMRLPDEIAAYVIKSVTARLPMTSRLFTQFFNEHPELVS